MLTRQELLQNPDLYRDKARGALIGLAIGDSFGDASRKPENQMAYGFTTDFNKGASWSTDDTEFAMLTAQILIESGGRPTSDCVVDAWLKHVATQDELKRGGASEFEASRNLRKGLRPPLSGRYNAYGQSDDPRRAHGLYFPYVRCACAQATSTAPLPWPKLTPPSATTARESGARSPWPPR